MIAYHGGQIASTCPHVRTHPAGSIQRHSTAAAGALLAACNCRVALKSARSIILFGSAGKQQTVQHAAMRRGNKVLRLKQWQRLQWRQRLQSASYIVAYCSLGQADQGDTRHPLWLVAASSLARSTDTMGTTTRSFYATATRAHTRDLSGLCSTLSCPITKK